METKTEQSARAVLMVRPTTFGFDDQTAQTNTFQHHIGLAHSEVLTRANAEFDNAVNTLRELDIAITVFEDGDVRPKPNAVFPNNWLSTWPNGHIFLYPMATESRRVERSFEALELLSRQFKISEVTDLSGPEKENLFLESTGVIIFDHVNKIAYACISPRCDERLFKDHVKELGYEPVAFKAYGSDGVPIYHTNVMMGVQTQTAVICLDAITDEVERNMVRQKLEATGHNTVVITQNQMEQFCGNVLELQNSAGERYLVMSQSAFDGFRPGQRQALSVDKTLIPLAIPTIETIGGGSVRCMLAEVYLPGRIDPSRIHIERSSPASH
ncbi:MAG TPA: arginine deiminase-related protein [Candidatus Saccharimonadales bacterium]|nr:arginine deiminase-related protein [Candidatus Saccharimonadales bacterium]